MDPPRLAVVVPSCDADVEVADQRVHQAAPTLVVARQLLPSCCREAVDDRIPVAAVHFRTVHQARAASEVGLVVEVHREDLSSVLHWVPNAEVGLNVAALPDLEGLDAVVLVGLHDAEDQMAGLTVGVQKDADRGREGCQEGHACQVEARLDLREEGHASP